MTFVCISAADIHMYLYIYVYGARGRDRESEERDREGEREREIEREKERGRERAREWEQKRVREKQTAQLFGWLGAYKMLNENRFGEHVQAGQSTQSYHRCLLAFNGGCCNYNAWSCRIVATTYCIGNWASRLHN